MYTRIHCSTVQQEFFPYMYEIEYFCLMTRKFDAVSITYVVNYTAFIESNILPDVFFAELQLLCGEIRTHLSMEIDSSLQVILLWN